MKLVKKRIDTIIDYEYDVNYYYFDEIDNISDISGVFELFKNEGYEVKDIELVYPHDHDTFYGGKTYVDTEDFNVRCMNIEYKEALREIKAHIIKDNEKHILSVYLKKNYASFLTKKKIGIRV